MKAIGIHRHGDASQLARLELPAVVEAHVAREEQRVAARDGAVEEWLPRPGDLAVELAALPRAGRPPVRLQRDRVEVGARELPAGGDQLGADALPDQPLGVAGGHARSG